MAIYAVTGTRRGIGLEYVNQISSNPANTVFALVREIDGDLSALKEIQSKNRGKIHILGCDTASDESVAPLADNVASLLGDGKINMLINNAAINHCEAHNEHTLALRPDVLLNHLDCNVAGPARVLQSLLPHLAPDAVIANITSGMGSLSWLTNGRIAPAITSYSVSKAALNMLTIHQAYYLKGKAIVVCVDPGHVKTKMGGPRAVMEIPDSAGAVLGSLHKLTASDNGTYINYDGTPIPW